MTTYNKYDIVYGQIRQNEDSIQCGIRPWVVIQNDIGNKFSPTILAIPLSSQIKNLKQPTHTIVRCDESTGLKVDSVLLAEQITTLNKNKIEKIGRVEDREAQRRIFKCFIYSAACGEYDQDLKELQFI